MKDSSTCTHLLKSKEDVGNTLGRVRIMCLFSDQSVGTVMTLHSLSLVQRYIVTASDRASDVSLEGLLT
jgi:hypothetical protein